MDSLGNGDPGFRLGDGANGLVYFFGADRLRLEQLFRQFEGAASRLDARLTLNKGRGGLVQFGLVGTGVDLEQHVALFHLGPILDQHFVEIARGTRAESSTREAASVRPVKS